VQPHDGPIAGLALDGRFLAWFPLADTPRPEAAAAMADLRDLGVLRQILLTGDRLRKRRPAITISRTVAATMSYR
jgi:cation transport ATPase